MKLTCHCPACEQFLETEVEGEAVDLVCPTCHHTRHIPSGAVLGGLPSRCLSCGNADLWRQKDFPQGVGLVMVALGAILSSIAWYYHRPVVALTILGAFAILDMVLFWVMPDVLVCYRCRARHRVQALSESYGPYDHELGERYRQERLRMEQGPTSPQAPMAG
ncbi:MAG: hypothetical protein ACK5Q5_23780 [Planctomycetaceae bacterium]